MDSEEYSYFDLRDSQNSSWYDGFAAGKDEVLGMMLPMAAELIERIDIESMDDPAVEQLVSMLRRWIEFTEQSEGAR